MWKRSASHRVESLQTKMIDDSNVGPSISSDGFFIVGCPRSGTTLLSVMLDRHPRLCVPPETAFFDEVAPLLPESGDDGLVLDVLRQWRRLPELKLEPGDVLCQLPPQQRTPSDVLAAILNLYARAQHKPRCGEKTPQNLWHVPAILRDFPDAKVICMLRDGRDVALSLNAMPWWSPRSLAEAADLWKHSVGLIETFKRQHPGRFKVCRYEDLVASPEDVLSSIMEYLGERFDPRQLQATIPSGVVLPRSMEWKGLALQPVDRERIARRLEAAKEDLDHLDRALHDELLRHGYDVQSPSA
jgi:hypothetical protein